VSAPINRSDRVFTVSYRCSIGIFEEKKVIKMKPILYFDNISPPVRSVLLLIEALSIDVDYEFVDLFAQEHLAADYVKVLIYGPQEND
jgi:hypothetical protein